MTTKATARKNNEALNTLGGQVMENITRLGIKLRIRNLLLDDKGYNTIEQLEVMGYVD
ncbi:hypothetical protein ACFLRF_05855 [Candidatus Altiarchaeota archaeon]